MNKYNLKFEFWNLKVDVVKKKEGKRNGWYY